MIVYTAGPYSEIEDITAYIKLTTAFNIAVAEEVAISLWNEGYTVICPHLNTRNFESHTKIPNSEFVERDLEIVERMDALVMLPHWELSKGARLERMHALEHGIPVFIWPERP